MGDENTELPHPLEGCDADDCYKTMMEERRALDTARRESEDNVVKTVMQLAAALLVVVAGFITQKDVTLSYFDSAILSAALIAFSSAILFGLVEQYLSGIAYSQQQVAMEAYYQRQSHSYGQPTANRYVRLSQLAAMISFMVAICLLAFLAASKAQGKANDRPTTASSPASPAPSTSSAPARERGR